MSPVQQKGSRCVWCLAVTQNKMSTVKQTRGCGCVLESSWLAVLDQFERVVTVVVTENIRVGILKGFVASANSRFTSFKPVTLKQGFVFFNRPFIRLSPLLYI